jgi:transcriptional regulator with XRE-family HTH domain
VFAKRSARLARKLGERIVSLRTEVGITQEKLAWEADIGSKGYLSRIESGQRSPSLEVLARLAERLGVEVRDLFIFPDSDEVAAAMEAIRREGLTATRRPAGMDRTSRRRRNSR